MYVSRCDVFSIQVHKPVTELVATRRDKAASLSVNGMTYGKIGVASVAVMGGVWGI